MEVVSPVPNMRKSNARRLGIFGLMEPASILLRLARLKDSVTFGKTIPAHITHVIPTLYIAGAVLQAIPVDI